MTENSTTTFMFDRALIDRAQELRREFQENDPFPHIVIDDFLPGDVIEDVVAEFPDWTSATWQTFDKETEVKLALNDTTRLGPATRNLLAEFNGQVFVEFLEALTGIDGLLPDPHYDGGGLHAIRRGGFLKVHADFNRHRRLNVDRRLNALLYLNPDWDESFGGALELWNRSMTRAVKVIPPVLNRLVVFATTDTSYHGHPDVLKCPADRSRRSMALYYYTNDRSNPGTGYEHSTLFQRRPGESFRRPLRETLGRWVPPAVMEFIGSRRS